MKDFGTKTIKIREKTRLKESVGTYGVKDINSFKEAIFKEKTRLEDYVSYLDKLESRKEEILKSLIEKLSYADKIKMGKMKFSPSQNLNIDGRSSWVDAKIIFIIDGSDSGIMPNENLWFDDKENDTNIHCQLESNGVKDMALSINFGL